MKRSGTFERRRRNAIGSYLPVSCRTDRISGAISVYTCIPEWKNAIPSGYTEPQNHLSLTRKQLTRDFQFYKKKLKKKDIFMFHSVQWWTHDWLVCSLLRKCVPSLLHLSWNRHGQEWWFYSRPELANHWILVAQTREFQWFRPVNVSGWTPPLARRNYIGIGIPLFISQYGLMIEWVLVDWNVQ